MKKATPTVVPSARLPWSRLGLSSLAYFLAQVLAFRFPDSFGLLTSIWPASGIALASLLLSPRRLWPALLGCMFAAGLAANLTTTRPFATSVGFMVANICETAASAWLITRWCGDPIRFSRLGEVLALAGATFLVNTVTAFIGAGAAYLTMGTSFWTFYGTWWVADGLGLLLVTPLIVVWSARGKTLTSSQKGQLIEMTILLALSGGVAWLAFGQESVGVAVGVRPYLLLVFVIWMAFRFGLRGVATLMGVISVIAISCTAAGIGSFPLGGEDAPLRLLSVQMFLGVMGLTGLLLAVSSTQQRESEKRHRIILQTATDGFWMLDLRGRLREVNEAYCRMSGYSARELLSMGVSDLAVRVTEDDVAARIQKIMARGEDHFQSQHRRKDGSIFDVEISVQYRPDDGGLMVAFLRNITDRKQAEERVRMLLEKSDEARRALLGILEDQARAEKDLKRLAMAVEQSSETIMITDPNGTIVYVNPAFEKITGYSRAEALGQTPRILKSGKHDEAFYQKMWQTLNRRETWSARVINKKKDGTLYEEESTISPVLGGEGKVINYVAVKRDMTHEVAVQRQLLQAQKLEAVGRLAGGVAHDFNNLLMVIGGYAGLLLKRLSEEHPGRNMVDEIRQAVKRGASLTQQLLALGSKQMVQVQSIQLNAIVEESGAMLKQLMSENVRVIRNCASDLVPVMGDSNQLGQVLMNLILNARDAMPKGGTLTVETSNLAAPAAMSLGFEEVPEGRYAMLSVRDTGMGMSLEVQTHIFEPFYTTKEKGKGTGFGLPIVYGIIKRFGGHLAVQSQVGEGSTFRILLPEARQAPPLAKAPSSGERMGAGTETLLLVEDEEALRRVTTEMLRSEGYHVIHASEAREALLALNNASISIDLMLSDVVMPGMQGTDLAMEALRLRPEMKVILMSGYSEHKVLDQVLLQKEIAFLAKPIPEEQLLRKLREVLDARDEGTRGSEK
ncbi:MAG: PAS domain S-box protein [Verrucomicrobiia bacterium]